MVRGGKQGVKQNAGAIGREALEQVRLVIFAIVFWLIYLVLVIWIAYFSAIRPEQYDKFANFVQCEFVQQLTNAGCDGKLGMAS